MEVPTVDSITLNVRLSDVSNPELFSIERYESPSGRWVIVAQVYGRRDANFTYKQVKTTNPTSKIRMRVV